MVMLIKLLIAHLIGDFVLQTSKSVKHKEKNGFASYHLYFHCAIHALLSFLLLWNLKYWYVSVIIFTTHLIIDGLKITLTTKKNARWLFLIDQALHISVIVGLVLWMDAISFFIPGRIVEVLWPLLFCILLLTSPVAIMLKVFFTRWKLTDKDTDIYGLKNAGKWIGAIERLLIFLFIVTDNFGAVGLLLTAKSVFRFGDLSKAKNMKLTEYVLIGTLLSFGIAILVGLLFKYIYL